MGAGPHVLSISGGKDPDPGVLRRGGFARFDRLGDDLARIPSEDTGVCIDTSHTSLGGTLFEAFDRFSDQLVHLQASDNHGKHDDHLPPGDGIIEWHAVLRALERAGYRSIFLFEVGGEGSSSENVKRLATSVSRWFPRWQSEPTEDQTERRKS